VKLFANKDAPVHMVLSEGEQTCVALSCTFAHSSRSSDDASVVRHWWGSPLRLECSIWAWGICEAGGWI